MRKVYFSLTIAAFVPLLLFIGCATDRYAVQQKEVPAMTLSEKGITVTMTYLTKDQLTERYGEKSNPFIPPPSLGGFNQFMVFDIVIESDIAADFSLKQAELHAEGKVEGSKNINHLNRYWEMELRAGDTPERILGRIKKSIRKNLIPNRVTLDPGSSRSGLVVFSSKFPRYGKFSLFIPLFNKSGEMIHNFRFDFEL